MRERLACTALAAHVLWSYSGRLQMCLAKTLIHNAFVLLQSGC